MRIYEPQSKNIVTLAIVTAFALIGVILVTALNKTGHQLFDGPMSTSNPYLGALFPLLFAGLPVLMLSGFIFGIFALGREESRLGRYQASLLLLIILVLAYLFSYMAFNGGY